MELAITQPFFELHTPDFAWKFIWIFSTNFEQNGNLQKHVKSRNCEFFKHEKIGLFYRSSIYDIIIVIHKSY